MEQDSMYTVLLTTRKDCHSSASCKKTLVNWLCWFTEFL